jgi:hypothetical protein
MQIYLKFILQTSLFTHNHYDAFYLALFSECNQTEIKAIYIENSICMLSR